jgi:hypothetical protein
MTPEERYRMLGRLVEEFPAIPSSGDIPQDVALWLGRADALVRLTADISLKVDWGVALQFLTINRSTAIQQIMVVIHRALAEAELEAPPSARGAFIPVGSPFDAFSAIGKLLRRANSDVFIIDPYMDEVVLTDYEPLVPDNVALRLLADQATLKTSLLPAATRWKEQNKGKRSLSVRVAPPRSIHDRAIIIDRSSAWTLTQSLKDFAKRAPAEIVDSRDLAALKIPAYEDLWKHSTDLV